MKTRGGTGAIARLVGALLVLLLIAPLSGQKSKCKPSPVEIVDADGDGIEGVADNCPGTWNLEQTDTDGDEVGDACDNCPDVANAGQEDWEADGTGDACSLVWTDAIKLDGATGAQVTGSLDVAVDAAGTATVVWAERDGATLTLYARRFVGGVWQPLEELDSGASDFGDPAGPRVAAGASGETVVVWGVPGAAGTAVRALVRAARGWPPPTTVTRLAWTPLLQADIGGGVAFIGWGIGIAWHDGSWSAPAPLPETGWDLSLGVDSSGTAIVAWLGSGNVATARHDTTGFGAVSKLMRAPQMGRSFAQPVVAVASRGRAVVAWLWHVNGLEAGVDAALYDPATGWSPEEPVSTVSAKWQERPRAAINNAGQAQVSWYGNDHGFSAIHLRGHDGTSWVDPSDSIKFFEIYSNVPKTGELGLDACGQALMTWPASVAGEFPVLVRVAASRADSAGAWEPHVMLDNGSETGTEQPSLDTNQSGRTAAAWRDETGVRVSRTVTGCVP